MSDLFKLDDIKPSVETTMTAELKVIFALHGCSPTACHACGKTIKEGQVFKLLPHKRVVKPAVEKGMTFCYPEDGIAKSYFETLDEMCCASCGEAELTERDKRDLTKFTIRKAGYSRISREENI